MQSEMPFFESPEAALRACVEALGGAKKVGGLLFPEKTVDNARDYLLACVNETRAEKLGYAQILFVFRLAKQAGFHAGWAYWSAEAEYDSRPVTRADEMDRLTTVVEQTTKTLSAALAKLERMQANA